MFFIKLISLIIIIYLVILLTILLAQRKFLYHPSMNNYLNETGLIHKVEKVTIQTGDKIDLIGWFHQKDIKKKTLLFFHGNAGGLDDRIYKLNHIGDLDINFLIIAYRGFNGNSGKPSEKGLYLDAKGAVSWLKSKGIDKKNIILYGESLGTGVAIETGKNNIFAGIILESPFTSMIEMGKIYYPYLPVRLLLKDKFESKKKIKDINFPILVMHGIQDKIVPFYMGKKIYELANQPKYNYFSEFDGHMMDFNNNLLNTLESFVKSLK